MKGVRHQSAPPRRQTASNMLGQADFNAYQEQFQLLTPSGKTMPGIDMKLADTRHALPQLSDDHGFSQRIHTEQATEVGTSLAWDLIIPLSEEDPASQ